MGPVPLDETNREDSARDDLQQGRRDEPILDARADFGVRGAHLPMGIELDTMKIAEHA
jgi:hypothetical protein